VNALHFMFQIYLFGWAFRNGMARWWWFLAHVWFYNLHLGPRVLLTKKQLSIMLVCSSIIYK